jgi:C1A family cysteine protease
MKSFIATTLSATTLAVNTEHQKEFQFMQHVAKWGNDFKTLEEYSARFARWVEVDLFIAAINHPESGETHTAGHNKFSTWHEHEYEALMTLQAEQAPEDEPQVFELYKHTPERLGVAPATLDWRTASTCVTPVKDQGSCGSCWSFATTETVETAYCQATGELKTFSEQQLVDCCTVYAGCNGGNYPKAWDYVNEMGQMLEGDYPYVAADTTCVYDATKAVASITMVDGHTSTSIGNYLIRNYGTPEEIMAGVAVRPAAIAVNASGLRFQTYETGVLNNCTNTSLNHAIVMDGYDSTASVPYYQVRNSWGASWGMNGYILLGMTEGNEKGNCGVQQDVDYPNIGANW